MGFNSGFKGLIALENRWRNAVCMTNYVTLSSRYLRTFEMSLVLMAAVSDHFFVTFAS